jgi:GntR family transcriptional regulator
MQISVQQFFVQPSSGVPLFRQLMDQVAALIASGQAQEDDFLPSTRELSAALEVNMMTVSKAWSKLEADGVLERVRGRGMKIAAPTKQSLAERKKRVEQLLKPAVLQSVHLGLTDEQVLAIVKRLLKGQRK